MPADANARQSTIGGLARALKSLSDLCIFEATSDPASLLRSLSGDFAPDVERIFPSEWAWAVLAMPRATRQTWFAVLSGLPDLPEDCTHLRRNLLMLDPGLMMRLRFGALAEPVRGIVTRLIPHPLPRGHYDELARMFAENASLIAGNEGQTGDIDTLELKEIMDYRKELRGEIRGKAHPSG